MWHKQSFTQFWSQSDAYSRRSSLKLTYIHHPLVVCTHQICCAVAVPIALSQDRLLHGHNRLVNWTPCSRMRESKLIMRNCNTKSLCCVRNEKSSTWMPHPFSYELIFPLPRLQAPSFKCHVILLTGRCSSVSTYTETERSSGWQPQYSLETLKTSFNVSSEY